MKKENLIALVVLLGLGALLVGIIYLAATNPATDLDNLHWMMP